MKDHVSIPPAPSSNVMRFQPRSATSHITRQLQSSLQAQALAPEIYAADQNLLRAPGDVAYDELRPEIAARFLDRAGIAVNLGDPIKREVANERAALAIALGIEAGLKTGRIPKDSPLAYIDLTSLRIAAKLALAGGLDYLSSRQP